MYDIRISARAREDLLRLDTHIANRIVLKLKEYRSSPDPMQYAKRLHGDLEHLFRFRIGDYRAIFAKSKDGTIIVLTVLKIQHRKEVYE